MQNIRWIEDRRIPPSPIENIFGFVIKIFDWLKHIIFSCSQNKMFTIFILYSTLTKKKHRVRVSVHQYNPQASRILPHRDRAPGSEIPGSATDMQLSTCNIHVHVIDYRNVQIIT